MAPKRKPLLLTTRERARLMADTAFSISTIQRWERNDKVLESVKVALDKSAKKLGLPVPQEAKA